MTDDYVRNAHVLNVYDGDTMTVVADMGFRMSIELKLRLNRIDTPELNTDAGKAARDALRKLLPVGTEIGIQTYKDPHEKYGRWLAEVWLGTESINDLLVTMGLARPYDGGKK